MLQAITSAVRPNLSASRASPLFHASTARRRQSWAAGARTGVTAEALRIPRGTSGPARNTKNTAKPTAMRIGSASGTVPPLGVNSSHLLIHWATAAAAAVNADASAPTHEAFQAWSAAMTAWKR
jgi:hypothetical protein